MSPGRLSSTTAQVAGQLMDWPRKRVTVTDLTSLLVDAEPALAHTTGLRARLAEVIAELADNNVVQLPSSRSYDVSRKPHVPKFVTRLGGNISSSRPLASSVAWRPELSWAADLNVDGRTLQNLRDINAFLRDGGASRPVVPLRERSVQLFQDEKRLEALSGSQLFAPGRLTLEQLRCEEVHPPFVYKVIGRGLNALVVENHHTYVSLTRTLPTDGDIGTVIYGAGAHFKGSVTYVADLDPRPRRVLYFGDIDADGLGIPVYADDVARLTGLPRIEPADQLYRLLFDFGRPATSEVLVIEDKIPILLAWLPADLRNHAERVLRTGQRIAQEWVGTELLSAPESRAL